jgi:hypothetical protein
VRGAAEEIPKSDLFDGGEVRRENDAIKMSLEFGPGFESNVFYSKTDPQSDFFTLVEGNLNGSFKPTQKSLLLVDLWASYQHFFKFEKNDRILTDLIVDYQYFTIPSMGIGLSNILSFADLKLFDTQGNALPREKFGSLSELVRLYGFFYPSDSNYVELGGSYRAVDVEETDNMESMDFKKMAADLSFTYFFSQRLSSRLKYEYSRIDYDDFQANSASGAPDPNNPKLRMGRQDVYLNLIYKKSGYFSIDLTGRLRLNDDLFEDDLTYRQGEIFAEFAFPGFKIINPYIELSYMSRHFSERKKISGASETLREAFFTGSIDLNRSLKEWLELYLRYQWIRHTSNAPEDGFDDHTVVLGIRLVR